MMRKAMQRISHWWFSPAPATRLAVLRVLVGAWVLYYVGQRVDMFARIGRTDPELFSPVGLAHLLSGPVAPQIFDFSVLALLVLAVLVALGVWHRWTGPAFGVMLLAVLSYRNSWSMIYHSDNVLVFHALIIGLAPSARAWSLDAWRAARSGMQRIAQPLVSWRFGWPIRLMCVSAIATYFIAGVAKVAGPLGWSWVGGEALRSQIAVDAVRKYALADNPPQLFSIIYDEVLLFLVIGVGSLALELAAPLFLVTKRAAKFWAIHAWLMHWGIFFIMGIRFRYQMWGLLFAPFFEVEKPIEKLIERWRRYSENRARPARNPQIILFDGECNFCNSSARFVIARDPRRRFRFASLQSEVGRQLMAKAGVDEAPLSTMILLKEDGADTKSSAAIRVAAQLGFLWPLASAALLIPKGVRDRVYDFVAARRHRIIRDEQCPLPSRDDRSRFLDDPTAA